MGLEVKTQLRMLADEVYETTDQLGNVVTADMRGPEEKKSQNPTELLLSAVAACAAVDIVAMMKKKRRTVVGLTSDNSGKRREEHPRHYTEMHIAFTLESPDATEEEFAKTVHLAVEKYCSVASTVDGKAAITHSTTVVRPA